MHDPLPQLLSHVISQAQEYSPTQPIIPIQISPIIPVMSFFFSSNVFYNPSPHPKFTNNQSLHFVSFPLIQNNHPVFIYFCYSWHWYLGKFQDNFLIESTTIWTIKVSQFMIRYRLSILTDTLHSGDVMFSYPISAYTSHHLGKVVCQSSPL